MPESNVLLVSCGKRKSNVTCKAKDMYNSCRFQTLKMIAETNNIKWHIMSAKYGLLSPNEIIDPYDLCITDCSSEYKKQWAAKMLKTLSIYSKDTHFIVAANSDYAQHIVPALVNKGYKVSAPFIDKDESAVLDYIKNASHVADAMELYDCIYRMAEETGGVRTFNECTGKMYWPQRGVYFFVDFNERSILSEGHPRIVRIGTHAISAGSKTTLWHRLKTHKGTIQGDGNHRGSIFRLHVGNAIIKKEGLLCDTWGMGQNASKEIREREKYIEHMVSDYIGQLGVIVLDVDDMPAATSVRAFVEKNSIALLSSTNSSFNFSTTDWLGNYSSRAEITGSCLWNINYINADYDGGLLERLWRYAEITTRNYKIK